MSAIQEKDLKLLFICNRWVNTIYSNYGVVKQRILLEILKAVQGQILQVMNGKKVVDFNITNQGVMLQLDMSLISHHNNYFRIREAVKEMSTKPIQIYNDPTFKGPVYFPAPLLAGYEVTNKKRVINLYIKKQIIELLLHVDYKPDKKTREYKAQQYTKIDMAPLAPELISCKYTYPLYSMICSYANRGGFTIGIEDLRRRLQVEEKYKGFDNFHRYVLKHVQTALQATGQFGFNFEFVKTGKEIKKVVFKIFSNKKYDPNHVWVRIVQALNKDLPYFARFSQEQREQFNYLLNGDKDLDKVYTKLQHIHKALVKRHQSGDAARNPFQYTLKAIHEEFPPG